MNEEYIFSKLDFHLVNGSNVELFEKKDLNFLYSIDNQYVYCPMNASFCIIEGEFRNDFFQEFLNKVKANKGICWILPPSIYPKSTENFDFLRTNGFEIQKIELAQYVLLSSDFYGNLSNAKKHRLKKMQQLGFESKLLTIDYFDVCYDLILKNRNKKNYKLSLERVHLRKLVEAFPENYLLVGTFFNNQLVACSVSIKVSDKVLYQFYWAHDSDFDTLSPLIFHNWWLASEAQKRGFDILDFGGSSIDGIINKGLFRFKEELGAKPSKKYYLTYTS